MWLSKTLSSVGFRNPFRSRKSETSPSRQQQSKQYSHLGQETTTGAATAVRQEEHQGREQGTTKRHSKKKKPNCYCCQRPFTKFQQFLTLGERRCRKCRNPICKTCAKEGRCHICIVKGAVNLDPQTLMKANHKDLVAILWDLHCQDKDLNSWPKRNLVQQILNRTGVHTECSPATIATTSPTKIARTTTQVEVHSSTSGAQEPLDSRSVSAIPATGNDCYNTARKGTDGSTEGSPKKLKETNDDEGKGTKTDKEKGELSTENSEETKLKMQKFLNRNSKDVEDVPVEDLCKICFDSRSDCILIDCGHMVTCSCCSDLINECPICRSRILRIITV